MFPMGIAGELAFMANNQFYVTLPDGTRFFAYRTLLTLKANVKSAAFMIGEEGDTIVSTSNWGEQQAHLLQGIQEQERC